MESCGPNHDMNSKQRKKIGGALRTILGKEGISNIQSTVERHSFDALRPHRGFPLPPHGFPPDFVAVPRSTSEVIEIVRVAKRYSIPLIPWGGGTGLMGGAVAAAGGILVDFRKMNKILDINRIDHTARVQPGALLGRVNKELQSKGLFLGHDPWTREYATVAGAISTNGMGYYGGKYGSMGDQVLGLKVVLADGTVIKTTTVPNSSTGVDLKRLFIGTEGSFGLITEATIRCFPKPRAERVFAYSFKNFKIAFKAVLKIRNSDIAPTSIDTYGEGYGYGQCTLYVMFSGSDKQVAVEEKQCRLIIASSGGSALSDREATTYWNERHQIADYYKQSIEKSPFASWREDKTFDFLHVALPASSVIPFWRKATRIAKMHKITLEYYGIWIKPELFAMNFTREKDVPTENLRHTVDEGMRLAIQLGGAFEYCHGVGMRLEDLMSAQHKNGFEVMKKLKSALDPNMILNPAKLGFGEPENLRSPAEQPRF